MTYDFSGRKALITGSSRGIGSAIALELARCKAHIFLHYVSNEQSALSMAEKIRALGAECTLIQADLCKPEQAEGIIEKCSDVDFLILNASVQYKNEWDSITVDEFYKQVNCNLLSSMLLMQQAYPYMKGNGFGRIITIGSVQETKPHPLMLVYAATKAAQTSMARSLAAQLAPFGITVNNIAPGVIFTDRNVQVLSDPDYAKRVTDSIPLRRFGKPDDIAGTVALLCSEQGSYITGQSIYIDGGKSL